MLTEHYDIYMINDMIYDNVTVIGALTEVNGFDLLANGATNGADADNEGACCDVNCIDHNGAIG